MNRKIFARCIFSFIIVFCGVLVLPQISHADDFYVSTSGTDDAGHGGAVDAGAWASLNYALTGSSISKGDTVYMQAGTYIEGQTNVNNSGIGAGDGNPVIVQNYGTDVVTIQTSPDPLPTVPSTPANGLFFINSVDITFDGINIDNNAVAMGGKYLFGVYSTAAPVNIIFQNASVDGDSAGNIRMFKLYGSQPHNLTINKADIVDAGFIVETAGTGVANNQINIYSSLIKESYLTFFPSTSSASTLVLKNNLFTRFEAYGFYLSSASTTVDAKNNIFIGGGSYIQNIWNIGTDFGAAAISNNAIFDVTYNYYYSEDDPFVMTTFGEIIASTQVVPYISKLNWFVDPSFTTIGSDYTLAAGSLVAARGTNDHPPDGTDINNVSYGTNDVGPYVNPTLTALPSLSSTDVAWHGDSIMGGTGASGVATRGYTLFDDVVAEDVTDYSIGGLFTRGMFWVVDRSIWTGREATAIVSIGINDIFTQKASQTNAQVSDMIITTLDKLDDAGITPVYLGVSSISGNPPDNSDVTTVVGSVTTECTSQGWSCASIQTQMENDVDWKTENYADLTTNVHPNDSGHAIFARLAEYLFFARSTMGTDEVDIGAGARLYADGEFRDLTTATGSTADFTVTPVGGVGLFDSDDKSAYMDVAITKWETSGSYEKEWTASSSTGAGYSQAGSTVYTIGDLIPSQYYRFKLDGVNSAAITGDTCDTIGVCMADSSGQVTFTYTGGYSSHTFALDRYYYVSSNNDVPVDMPTGLTVEDYDGGGVKVSWETPETSGDVEILVYKGLYPYPVNGVSIAAVSDGSLYYMDEEVTASDLVTYQLRARSGSSYSSLTDTVTFIVGVGDDPTSVDDPSDDDSTDDPGDDPTDEGEGDPEEGDEVDSLSDLGLTPPEHWSSVYFDALDENEALLESVQDSEMFLELMNEIIVSLDVGMTREKILYFLLEFADFLVVDSEIDAFSDVTEDREYGQMIEFAADNDLVQGYPDGTFGPEIVASRVETLKMIAYFLHLELDDQLFGQDLLDHYGLLENPFVDIDIEAWYAPYVIFAYSNGIVRGYQDGSGTFGPANSVTYAEFLKIAALMADLVGAIELAGELE